MNAHAHHSNSSGLGHAGIYWRSPVVRIYMSMAAKAILGGARS